MNNETFELFFAMLSVATLAGTVVILLSRTVARSSSTGMAIIEGFRPFARPLSAAIATTWAMLKSLDLDTRVPGGGTLLSGAY